MTRFRFRPLLAAFAVLAGIVSATALAAPASAEDPAPVSWSVVPADASGPDGRVSVDHGIDAGASVEDHFAVRNLGKGEVTFRLSAADGFYNKKGRFDMLPSDQASVAAGTWISLPPTVTVAPGGTVVVPYTIAVPKDAEPGDHAAGIAASVMSVKQGDGAGVGVESRVGFRVMVRVAGDVVPAFAVKNVHADYASSWNPLRPGSVSVSFDVANTGNVRLAVAGAVGIAGRSVPLQPKGARAQEILPGEKHAFSVVVDDAWPLFLLAGDITVSPSARTVGGEALAVPPSKTSLAVWAVPWAQLLVLVGVALIVMALLWRRGRSKRRLEDMLESAREEARLQLRNEGAASALGPGPTT